MSGLRSYLLDGLNLSALDAICRDAVKVTRQKLKFADLDKEMTRAWKTVKGLGLDQSPPLDVLDLGLGAGYFLYVCQRLGHRVVGLDRPGLPVWPQICNWLGVKPIIEQLIEPYKPLPTWEGASTSSRLLPVEHRLWTIAEWSFSFDDLRDHILSPDVLKLRREIRGLKLATREATLFEELCHARGLTGSGSMCVFHPLR
jgi:hypothetical protein